VLCLYKTLRLFAQTNHLSLYPPPHTHISTYPLYSPLFERLSGVSPICRARDIKATSFLRLKPHTSVSHRQFVCYTLLSLSHTLRLNLRHVGAFSCSPQSGQAFRATSTVQRGEQPEYQDGPNRRRSSTTPHGSLKSFRSCKRHGNCQIPHGNCWHSWIA
jgi:hypothetical protein